MVNRSSLLRQGPPVFCAVFPESWVFSWSGCGKKDYFRLCVSTVSSNGGSFPSLRYLPQTGVRTHVLFGTVLNASEGPFEDLEFFAALSSPVLCLANFFLLAYSA